jgi:hypothetical protein
MKGEIDRSMREACTGHAFSFPKNVVSHQNHLFYLEKYRLFFAPCHAKKGNFTILKLNKIAFYKYSVFIKI